MQFGARAALGRRSYIYRAVPFAVFLIGFAMTAAAVVTFAVRQQTTMTAAFRSDTLAVQRVVQVQVDTMVAVTHAAAALLAASPEINFVEFRAFVSGLQLRERYPGLNGIGFAPRVEESGLQTFVRDVSLDSLAELDVRPEGSRPEYFPAVLLEPTDAQNASAIGFDLGADPVQLAAMTRARDSGADAITPLLESNAAAGRERREFVLFLPVYRRGAPVDSPAARRRALVGFVFGRLQPAGMFSDGFAAAAARSLDISIYDTTKARDTLLVSSGMREGSLQSEAALSVGGRQWLMVATPHDPASGAPPEAGRIMLTGTLLSLLLFALLRMQMRAWETAELHAAELRVADRAKDEFLAVLSHELRTPLNAMLGWISMLRSGSVRDDRRQHALEVIDRNAQAQARLIEDLLEVSRILMGKMRLEQRPLAVVPAVGAVVELLRPTAENKGLTLHGVDPAQAPDSFVIAADSVRFAQIVTNLVTNAIKFTPSGGNVRVGVEAADGSVSISVRDTGIGIAPEFLPFVFDRFRQADVSPTRSHGGLGMGLAIVRDLVVLHGGEIVADSKGVNQGALFVVTLPLVAAEGDTVAEPTLDLAGR
jgi:signal transduction histidine kinase